MKNSYSLIKYSIQASKAYVPVMVFYHDKIKFWNELNSVTVIPKCINQKRIIQEMFLGTIFINSKINFVIL